MWKLSRWEHLKKILGQAVRFIGISGVGWFLDFLAYTCLRLRSCNLVLNNTISSWMGVTFVFIFATQKVFKNKSNIALLWKYLIYILYQCVLIFFISRVLNGINIAIISCINIRLIMKLSPIIAKLAVTPITMILNFWVMKELIEKL